MREREACRRCGNPLLFAEDHKGRRVPLDAEPTPDGQWTLLPGETEFSLQQLVVRNPDVSDLGYRKHKCEGKVAA